jgi:hypothetical protein
MTTTLTKTALSPTVMPGGLIVYNIALNNAPASFFLSDFLPPNTAFVGITQIAGPYSPLVFDSIQVATGSTGEVILPGPPLGGPSFVFQLTLRVNASIAVGTVIVNTAQEQKSATTSSATVTVVAPAADVSVNTAGPPAVYPGIPASFITTVTNNGGSFFSVTRS